MHEFELHDLLIEHPEIIEPGLKFIDREVLVGSGLRCDLLFQDEFARNVYVEVKWKAGRRSVVQIEQYETLLKKSDDSRFLLVALSAKPAIPEILAKRGFNYVELSHEKILLYRPEWKQQIDSSLLRLTQANESHDAIKTRVPKDLKDNRLKILIQLTEELKEEFPSAYYTRHPKEGDRVIIPWMPPDNFIVYFSKEVIDAIRFGFVVDLDIKRSKRRDSFQQTLSLYIEDIEEALGAKVLSAHKISGIRNKSSERILKEGYKEWVKISHHRKMGLFKMVRLDFKDWGETNDIVGEVVPQIYKFIEGVDSILQRIRPPKIESLE